MTPNQPMLLFVGFIYALFLNHKTNQTSFGLVKPNLLFTFVERYSHYHFLYYVFLILLSSSLYMLYDLLQSHYSITYEIPPAFPILLQVYPAVLLTTKKPFFSIIPEAHGFLACM